MDELHQICSPLFKKCTAEPQRTQRNVYFIRIPEMGILIKATCLFNATALVAAGLFDSYFPPSQGKIRKKNKLCELCTSREQSERAVN